MHTHGPAQAAEILVESSTCRGAHSTMWKSYRTTVHGSTKQCHNAAMKAATMPWHSRHHHLVSTAFCGALIEMVEPDHLPAYQSLNFLLHQQKSDLQVPTGMLCQWAEGRQSPTFSSAEASVAVSRPFAKQDAPPGCHRQCKFSCRACAPHDFGCSNSRAVHAMLNNCCMHSACHAERLPGACLHHYNPSAAPHDCLRKSMA